MGRGRGRKIPSDTVVNEEIPQEEQQPGPSQQYNNLAKSSNDESRTKILLRRIQNPVILFISAFSST